MLKRAGMAALAALAVTGADRVHAQDPDAVVAPLFYVGIQGMYARPVGEFRDYVKHGGGLNVNFAWPVTRGGPFALRADGGFIVYGSETRRVCFSTTVGCRIQLDLTTTNSIGYLNIGPQLMLPDGPVRPYVNAGIGGSYFGTSSSVDGVDGNDNDFANTTNFDDVTLAWTGGGGLLISLSRGNTPVLLDLGVKYHGNGEVEYLKKGDIVDNPDGTITITPTRSQANLLTFQIGVQIGASRKRSEF
jgi:opacity protein-like surface antigen